MSSPSWKYGEGGNTPVTNIAWHKASERDLPGAVTAVLNALERTNNRRFSQYALSSRLYGNQHPIGLIGPAARRSVPTVPSAGLRDRTTFNVIASTVDTLTSKLARVKPRALFLTNNGDYALQRRAKKLTTFVEGIFAEQNAYELGIQVFRDAAVLGEGVVQVFEHEGRVKFERVFPSELFTDELESIYGSPRSLFRVRAVDRACLTEVWGNKECIKSAPPAHLYEDQGEDGVSDLVTIREAWRLPSGKDAKDGRHTITLAGGVLLDELWERDHFPFAVLRYSKRLAGYWGQGLAEALQNLQVSVNRTLWLIDQSYATSGTQKILVPVGSKINREELNPGFGQTIFYTGNPPSYISPQIIQPEIYNHLENLIRKAYEVAGISQLSAAAMKPPGITAAAALRELTDAETTRYLATADAYENWYLELARLALQEMKSIMAQGKRKYTVASPGTRFLESVEWSDVAMEDDEYVIQAYKSSRLPQEPVGRLQTVSEMIASGFVSQREGARLLELPDLAQVQGLKHAAEDHILKSLDAIIDKAEFTPPEPFDDLALAQELCLEYYQRGKVENLEEEKLELLRRYLAQVNALRQAAQPPPPPQMPLPAPQGAPGPAPGPLSASGPAPLM